jgi:hypothetical protein
VSLGSKAGDQGHHQHDSGSETDKPGAFEKSRKVSINLLSKERP